MALFKYKISITGSTYNVYEKVINAEGDEINNPAYDANKLVQKSWNCCTIKLFKQILEKTRYATE